METTQKQLITIQSTIKAPVDKVWISWTLPKHIKNWNYASDDWHTIFAENDLRVGGKFLSRMEAKDGSFGFDFCGTYEEVQDHELISYTIEDGRKVKTIFQVKGNETTVCTSFEAESSHSIDQQQQGWQSILDNFKKYTERLL